MTLGQQIVAAHEADMIAEPCELAQRIDDAVHAERQRCAKIAESWMSEDCVIAKGIADEIRSNQPTIV